MRNDLIPNGATLLAVALLSRGRATAPRALVAYRDGEACVTHEVNLEVGGRFYGHYDMTDAEALADFHERVALDIERYVSKGVPLTEPAWLEVESTLDILNAKEEGRLLTSRSGAELAKAADAEAKREALEKNQEASDRILERTMRHGRGPSRFSDAEVEYDDDIADELDLDGNDRR